MKSFWTDSWSDFIFTLDQKSYVLHTPAWFLFVYGPLVIVAALLFKGVSVQEVLGVKTAGFKRYLIAASACCLPMAIGYAYLSNEVNISLVAILTGSIYAGVFEEIIYRAALFGALFHFCRLGFIPAALFSSLIFGLVHIYQGHDAMSALMAVGITTIAGAWFSWLYCECGYRIWFPLWMHIFMNAAYGIFGMSGGAVGDLEGNIFKASAIILSIVYVNLNIRRGKQREVTLSSLWRNQASEKSQPSLTVLAS